MKSDHIKPTLRARLQTMALLLDREAGGIPGYLRERDRLPLLASIQAGWREVMRIKARAAVDAQLEDPER